MSNTLKIGIILGSTREGRVSPQVGEWVLDYSKKTEEADFELLDIKTYDLPFFGTSKDATNVDKWKAKLNELDGFIFVVAEYNHSMTGVLKNALDSAYDEWNNKAAAIVSYGSGGGIRATEHLRNSLSELQVAHVRAHVQLSLFTDFENWKTFKPQDLHKKNMDTMMSQLISWTKAMKSIR